MGKIEDRYKTQLVDNPMYVDEDLLTYVTEYDNGEKMVVGDQYLHGVIRTGVVEVDSGENVESVNLIYLKPEHLSEYELDEPESGLTVQPIIKRKSPIVT